MISTNAKWLFGHYLENIGLAWLAASTVVWLTSTQNNEWISLSLMIAGGVVLFFGACVKYFLSGYYKRKKERKRK